MQININGLARKIYVLELLIETENVDILLLSEHGLKQSRIKNVKFQNFKLA